MRYTYHRVSTQVGRALSLHGCLHVEQSKTTGASVHAVSGLIVPDRDGDSNRSADARFRAKHTWTGRTCDKDVPLADASPERYSFAEE